jgi:tetratricopeptide (TPR) repeat protein
MTEEGNAFSPQLPESFEYSAALYESHREFRASLEKIAGHIISGGAPMSFALYGAWGAGKSTALAYLQGLIQERDAKVTFSWCQAPLWARYEDERSALALQILRGVERGIPASVADMLARLLKFDVGVASGQSDSDDYDLAASLALLNVLRNIPNAPPVIEEWIRRYITRSGAVRHVVVLDDLDRCPPDFVARLLKATNYWTTDVKHINESGEHHGASIYFVLACREDFLVSSQLQEEVKDPRQSLEKYVHVTVSLPTLLSRPADAATYLRMLVGHLNGLPAAARDQLTMMIDASERNYPNGLLAPLLRVGGSPSTPRAVKTRLNLVLTEIDTERLEDNTLVKEWIIKAFWPDFWANQYRALVTEWQHVEQRAESRSKNVLSEYLSERFEPIQAVGSRLMGLLDMPDESITEAFRHVGAELRADLTDVKPQLAIYLASDPPWPTRASRPASSRFAPDGRSLTRQSDAEKPQRTESDEHQPSADLVPPNVDVADPSRSTGNPDPASGGQMPADPNDQIFLFYLAADSAENRRDRDAVEENLSQLLGVARWLGTATTRATDIGNAALLADRMGLPEIALELHQFAVAARPGHINIAQNYIDFILDQSLTDKYAEARRLYHQVLTGSPEQQFRTLIIGMRLDGTSKQPAADLAERREKLQAMLAEDPRFIRFFDIAKIPSSILGYDTMRSVTKIFIEHSPPDSQRSRALQVLGAVLGRSNNPVHEREVTDLTRWLISVGISCDSGGDLYAADLYNLGLQLGSLGYRRAATLLYAEAHQLNPADADIRRSLASSLERMGRNEDATAVLVGQSPNLKDVESEEIPDFLSAQDDTDRWWERLGIKERAPCPTNLTWLITPAIAARSGTDRDGS